MARTGPRALAARPPLDHRPRTGRLLPLLRPADSEQTELGRVTGARCAIEECFHTAKDETGPTTTKSWYRHITVSMAAAAFIVPTRDTPKKGVDDKPDSGLIPLTVDEIRKLFNRIAAPIQHTVTHTCTGHTGEEPAKPSPHQALPPKRSRTVVQYQRGVASDRRGGRLSWTFRDRRDLDQAYAETCGHDRPCHPEVAGQTTSLQMWSGAVRRYADGKLDTIVQKLATEDR